MEKRKVDLAAKLLSSHDYLNEVPVEGEESGRFNFNIAYYDLYATQTIRAGNCITLLTTKSVIAERSLQTSLANFIRYPAACGRVVLCFIANERNFHYEKF